MWVHVFRCLCCGFEIRKKINVGSGDVCISCGEGKMSYMTTEKDPNG